MLIGLQDVDGHNYPNLPLMKLSAWHKMQGDDVEWYREDRTMYDIVYKSKVFSDTYSPDTPDPQNAKIVKKGGTGYYIHLIDGKEVFDAAHHKNLPDAIEHIYPDYSIYAEYTGFGKPLKQQTCYGFLTRGCPRGCGFCHVGPKEGRCSHKTADLSEFWHGQGHIVLCDPNILACRDWRELLQQCVDSGANIDLNQGIDARLLTYEKALLLAQMKMDRVHFAMDSMGVVDSVAAGLKNYVQAWKTVNPDKKWRDRNGKVFVLTNFDTTFNQDMQRIEKIRECECIPFVMIYNKPSAPKITQRLQQWTNNVKVFKAYKTFWDFQRGEFRMSIMQDGTEIINPPECYRRKKKEPDGQLSLFD